MLSLTDMWKAAGSDPQRAPAKWREQLGTKAFVEHVALTVGKTDSDLFATTNGGRNPGTFAHWQIGLAYAPTCLASSIPAAFRPSAVA